MAAQRTVRIFHKPQGLLVWRPPLVGVEERLALLLIFKSHGGDDDQVASLAPVDEEEEADPYPE